MFLYGCLGNRDQPAHSLIWRLGTLMENHNDKSGKTACICCNGEIRNMDRAWQIALRADLLIAADGGAAHLVRMNLKPHVIIGDMDSLLEDPWKNDESVQRIPFPANKDRSDAELAVQWAFEQGVSRILLLGAWGGRIDHTLGNSVILLRYPGQVALWDDGVLVQALSEGQGIEFYTKPGAVFSMFPFESSTRVKTTGLKYSLEDEILEHATHGLSNMATGETCSVSVSQGMIILCIEGGDKWLTN